ncbi:protein of unknown function [Pseudomonas mediterranea]
MRELSCHYSYWSVWETGEAWLRHIARKLSYQIDRST